MEALQPLYRSQSKNELLKHLNISPETYFLMAKETDIAYTLLTSDKSHLKENCKREPPYDWSDIREKSKDEAMESIAESENLETKWVWSLAASTPDCPNWIAKWFLYRKFRYRDGRNKSSGTRKHNYSHGHRNSSKPHHHQSEENESHYLTESMTSAPVSQGVVFYDAVRDAANQETAKGVVFYDAVRDAA